MSLARYNDSLTLEQLIVAHNKIKANAASLYNEAQLLFENEMYARSYFLLCIASEELGKSIIVISAIVDLMAEEINWRSFWKKLRNHKDKTGTIEFFENAVVSSDDNFTPWRTVAEQISDFEEIKMASLYADIFQVDFFTPNEIISAEMTKAIAKPGADEYEVAFKKGALSVIENVIFANDLERRWIQSHPSILYDCWLVDGLLVQFDEYMRNVAPMTPDGNKPAQKPSTVFTKDALSSQGVQGLVAPLRLLCDDDIICYAKNIDNSFYGKQYFSRKDRFKPLWKTEASYENLTNGVFGDRFLSEITSSLRCLISPQAEGVLINQNFIDSINKQLEKAEKAELSTASYTTSLGICDIFKKFKEENSLPDFEFVVLFTRKFQSAYKKDGLNQMKLELETGLVPIKDVLSVQAKEASQQTNSNLFYVYTTESNLRRQSDLGKNFIDCLRRQYKRQL